VPDDRALSLADFDRYLEEHGITEEDYPAAFAQWIAEIRGGPVPRVEKVEEWSGRCGDRAADLRSP
jgi:hypothetical protein